MRGKRTRLQDQPFQVLRVLLERRGELVTRDELKQTLWSADAFGEFDDGLNTAVRKIREALGDAAEKPRYIETIPRHGYRFVGRLADFETAVLPSPVEEPKGSAPEKTNVAASSSGAANQENVLSRRRKVLLAGVAALAVVSVALVLYRGSSKGAKQPPIRSLAVLPLKNLSGDPTQEYLADGMTEALISRLAGIHNLRVIPRTSISRFKDTPLSVPAIASALGVDAIVEGSVVREGDRIRVYAQLIRATNDEYFWSEAYDRELRDVLSLQSDVAQSIARRVEVTVTGEEHARLSSARTVDPEAYEAYLKGRYYWNKRTADGMLKAARYFEQAISRDPGYDAAYSGLADCNSGLAWHGFMSPAAVLPKASAAAQRNG